MAIIFSQVLRYEDRSLQEKARSCVPLARLRAETEDILEELHQNKATDGTKNNDIGFEDVLMLQLIRWFKREFFKWVNAPDCDACGAKNPTSAGSGTPTAEEERWGGHRVELYKWVGGWFLQWRHVRSWQWHWWVMTISPETLLVTLYE
jgi:peptide-N4-(N-acetyl-beta-glucosaminyl)asparagine amidase